MYSYENDFINLCNGKSCIELNTKIFIKHLSVVDSIKLSTFRNKRKSFYLENGYLDESILIQKLIESGKWSIPQEREINSLKEEVRILNSKKKKIKDFYEIEPLYNTIEDSVNRLQSLFVARHNLLAESAENLADIDCREYLLLNFCFSDENMTIPSFSQEDLDYTTHEELDTLSFLYYNEAGRFSAESLKNMCIKPFCLDILGLMDDYKNFFGKPPLELTSNQVTFLKIADNYAKAALEEPIALEKFPDNAEKMIMCFFCKRNGGIIPSDTDDDQFKLDLYKLEQICKK